MPTRSARSWPKFYKLSGVGRTRGRGTGGWKRLVADVGSVLARRLEEA